MKIFRNIAGLIVLGCLIFLGGAGTMGEAAPPNGVVREFYPTGKIRVEFRYKNGVLLRRRTWYKNGQLMSDYRYRDGRPVLKRDYYENGRLKSIWSRKTGVLKFYRKDGTLKAAVSSRSDGLFH